MTEAEALDMAAKAAGWVDYNIALYNDGDVESIRAHAKTLMENAALKAENERLREAVQAQMDAKHREAAEAKLWFTKAQEWKAENARLLEELFLLKSLPDDIAETVIKLGPVEWGQTDPKDANGHGESVKNSVELTAAHFQQEGLQPMNGLYLVGEETVVCHTGTSPNSAQVARALTGAWNLMWDHARAALKEIEGD